MSSLRSLCILVLLFFGCNEASSQTFYLWSDIDPEWKSKSLQHWKTVKGYSDKFKAEIITQINTEYTSTLKQVRFDLYEILKRDNKFQSVVNSDKPTTIKSLDGDFYGELQVKIDLPQENFPYYHGHTFSGEANVIYSLGVYNSSGLIVRMYIEEVKYDLRKVCKELSSKSNAKVDVEGHSKLIDMSKESAISKIASDFNEDLKSGSITKAQFHNAKEFSGAVDFLFEQRQNDYPEHYDYAMKTSSQDLAQNQRSTIAANKVEHAAYDDAEIATKIGEELAKVKNYALIIGVNNYEDPTMTDLDNPINDAETLMNTLTSLYTFDKANIMVLKDPKRDNIIDALDHFSETVSEKDNLLIFYAGHGLWDERLRTGYWLPSDARKDSRSDWFSNNDLVGYIGGIQSKHTLLIADACFSGGIFKTREAFTGVTSATLELYKMPSRKAMTSGTMDTVPDKSVFIQYLVKRLVENTKPFLSSEELFSSFKAAVINNSPNNQVPQFGDIRETGDEGGDYIFIRKK